MTDAGSDAIAGLRERRSDDVRAYCEELCTADQVEEACRATFVEFAARVREALPSDDLDHLLLHAARSVAGARALIEPLDAARLECEAMPELLAARANGELPGDDRLIRDHLVGCIVCESSLARMHRAERALVPRVAEEELVPRAAEEELTVEFQAVEAAPAPPPLPAAPPPAPIIVRRRSGGLVGALRRTARKTLE